MNRFKRNSAATILAGTMLALSVTPALAQTSPGANWILIGQQTVSEWYADPTTNGEGKWNLIGVTDRRYFLADGNFQRILDHAIPESGRDDMGISDRVYKTEKILKRTPRDEFDRELKNPNRIYREGNLRVLTRLSRYNLWDDVDFETPWDKFYLFRDKTRALNVFRFQWTDPVVNKVLKEMDPKTEYTAWTYGTVYRNGVAESGIQPGFRTENNRYVDRDEIFSKLALGIDSLTAAAGSRSGLFSGDSGSGAAKPVLETAKVRTSMGANEAKAADVKAAEAEFDAAQASLEELRKQFQESLKAVEEAGGDAFDALKKEIDTLTDKKTREDMLELLKVQQEGVKDFAKTVDEKAKEQYAVAKKTGTKLNDYRTTIESGLEKLDARYEQAQAAVRVALDRAFAAEKTPVVVVVPTPAPTPIPVIVLPSQPVVVAPTPAPVLDEVAKAVGTYRTVYGSVIVISRNGNSNNIKIDGTFDGGLKGYKGTLQSVDFSSKSWNLPTKNGIWALNVRLTLNKDGTISIVGGNGSTGIAKK
jgi:hypothetical protein